MHVCCRQRLRSPVMIVRRSSDRHRFLQHEALSSMISIVSALSLSVLLLLFLAPAAEAIKLKFRESECVSFHQDAYHTFYGSFVSIPDVYSITGRMHLTITAPSGSKVHETGGYGSIDGKFTVQPFETGNYKFCLAIAPGQMGLSRYVTAREAILDVHSVHDTGTHDKIGEEDTAKTWEVIQTIDGQIQQLKATSQYLYWRERRHRQTVDSTNTRVLRYALLRNGVVITISLAQVLFVRKLFAKRF